MNNDSEKNMIDEAVKDEFNTNPAIVEDRCLDEFEYTRAIEHDHPAEEPDLPLERFPGEFEQKTFSDSGKTGEKQSISEWIKKLILIPIASALIGTTAIFSSFGIDPLGADFLNALPLPAAVAPATADDAFPKLSNLARNSPLSGTPYHAANFGMDIYGVLDENYITVRPGGSSTGLSVFANDGSGNETFGTAIPGLTYDPATNTLTMNNYAGPEIDINMMGNSFTIELIGANSVDSIIIFGFYSGGSLTFTGNGSLTVNKNKTSPVGILMESEWSETCLMIDKGVTLDVYGNSRAETDFSDSTARNLYGAVMISDTTMTQAIYYLAPITLEGGQRCRGIYARDFYGNYADSYNFGSFFDYSIVDENGDLSPHVVFKPGE